MSESEWLIYQVDGAPIGPLTTSAIVEGILAGNLRPDVWIAAPGGSRWLCAKDVPVIAKLIDAVPTKRQSGMRIVTAPIPISSAPRGGPKKFDDTVRTASPSEQKQKQKQEGEPEEPQQQELDLDLDLLDPLGDSNPAPTIRSLSPRGPDGFPIPPPPSSSSSPSPSPTPPTPNGLYRGGETLESPGQERSRKKTQGA